MRCEAAEPSSNRSAAAGESGTISAAAEPSGTKWAKKGGTKWADKGGTNWADEGGTKCASTGAEADKGGTKCAVAEPSGERRRWRQCKRTRELFPEGKPYRRPVIRTRHGGESTREWIARVTTKRRRKTKGTIDIVPTHETNEPRSHHDSHTSHDSPQIPVLLYTELYLTWNACVQAGPIAITCTYTICPVTAPHGCGESHAAVLCGACENTPCDICGACEDTPCDNRIQSWP